MLTQNNLTPSLMLQLQFKAGRCLEKLKQIDEAIDQYYTEVIVRFLNERTRGTWFDERSTGLFVRAGFTVAELYEQKGHSDQAIRVLQRVVQSGVPGADEARQRIERLRGKRTGGA
jgi:lipopolysaccharide biosynthesis regulator YciM